MIDFWLAVTFTGIVMTTTGVVLWWVMERRAQVDD